MKRCFVTQHRYADDASANSVSRASTSADKHRRPGLARINSWRPNCVAIRTNRYSWRPRPCPVTRGAATWKFDFACRPFFNQRYRPVGNPIEGAERSNKAGRANRPMEGEGEETRTRTRTPMWERKREREDHGIKPNKPRSFLSVGFFEVGKRLNGDEASAFETLSLGTSPMNGLTRLRETLWDNRWGNLGTRWSTLRPSASSTLHVSRSVTCWASFSLSLFLSLSVLVSLWSVACVRDV